MDKETSGELGRLHDIILGLKAENNLKTNKLARILRFMTAYEMCGQKEVPIKEILKIINADELI